MIFSIIWGVLIFVRFLAFAGISTFSDWVLAIGVSPYLVLLFVIVLLHRSGHVHGWDRHDAAHFADAVSHHDKTCFRRSGSASSWSRCAFVDAAGRLELLLCQRRAADISLHDIFRNVWPFVLMDFVCIALFTACPGIVTFLPRMMMAN